MDHATGASERPMPTAKRAADRALALAPNLAEAWTARACIRAVFDWEWYSAMREFDTALGMNFRSAQARQWLAMNCFAPRGMFA